MKIKLLFLFLFCLGLFQNYAQNQPSLQKEKLKEFRTLFVQKVQTKSGILTHYKNIDFKIDYCTIEIKTIDYENSNNENSIISLPISGANLKENGEIDYEKKAIKEVITNKVTKQITTHFYSSSKEIGLFLKLENKEKHKEMQELMKVLSGSCSEEKQ